MNSKTHTELIKYYADVSKTPDGSFKHLVHLSKSPLVQFIQLPQLFAFGDNIGGRPDGLWVANGDSWLYYVTITKDPEYNSYRYLYEVNIKPQYVSKMLIVSNDNFNEFDNSVSSYWLNFDYFNINIKDIVSGQHYVHYGELKFDFARMKKKSLSTMYDILIANGIIFDSISAARNGSKFYSTMGNALIERFKYKNWHELSKNYCGIYFPDYSKDASHHPNKYFWYQTLDIPSGCIWDKNAFVMDLKYELNGDGQWKTVVK
jgi:hypothetical protein